MLEASIGIHDRYQVELKMGYTLPEEVRSTSYELDLYLYAPRSLGINPETYSKQQFYSDLQTYIRLKTPLVPLLLIGQGPKSPLGLLKSAVEAVQQAHPETRANSYENEIKIFCCILKSATRDFVKYILNTPGREDKERLVEEYVTALSDLTAEYRKLRKFVQMPGIHERALELYSYGDEYISLLVEDYTFHLLEGLNASKEPIGKELKHQLLMVSENEVQYRESRGYPSIPEEERDNETLVFRRSVLKKYMASILFLDTKTRRSGVLLEQTLFGIAAGVAMVFATGAAFISQSVYGTLTTPFFLALVISYIFKDRIKDSLRLYFSRRVTRSLFDHKTKIQSASGGFVGYCKESCEFIPERKIPDEIHALRDRDHITEIENGLGGEQTLLYRKRVQLEPSSVREIFSDHQVSGVNDIMRLNIQEFLRKMDDPKKELFIMDDEGYQRIHGTRVYHLNMVARMVHGGNPSLKRYRIVLTRSGIARIETVIS